MLKPSLDGIVLALVLFFATLGVWTWNLYKHKFAALLRFGTLTFFCVLIFAAVTHWSSTDADGLLLGLLILHLVIGLLSIRIIPFARLRYLAAGLLLVTAMYLFFHLFAHDDLKLYLNFRLSSEAPNINLYYWADRPDVETDWTDVFNTWPANETLVREAVLTYLVQSNDNSSRVYRNEKFRDATFEAWAAYNARSQDHPIDFSSASYYEDCAMNVEFMKWWTALAASDVRHEPGLIWFLEVVTSHAQYMTAEQLTGLEDSLRACQLVAASSPALASLLVQSLTAIGTQRAVDGSM